ncbi:NUDIX domain-containing protein [Natronosporangium hydrolyticum]|uniref:NUDIX domain-containing protein n=1 Tax=Natronosporangium hydrolyticum TaxID=2811111 RepID=A0A895YPX0_9ACTN|nr:NUDIX domain-containing protein [Natronosporangium hydrolyticum]QSB16160.1 NUDIX domain-containing protein [Natronosporangium hydrolyticum]
MTEAHVRSTLDAYLDRHPADEARLEPLRQLLDSGADLTSRVEFRGHATAGAVLTDPIGRILQVHHLALSRWLLPGGHLEAADGSLSAAALRELVEETGIDPNSVCLISDVPVDIDIHFIPSSQAKGEPGHQHIDFRFRFHTFGDVGLLQSEEITAVAWRRPADLAATGPDLARLLVRCADHGGGGCAGQPPAG